MMSDASTSKGGEESGGGKRPYERPKVLGLSPVDEGRGGSDVCEPGSSAFDACVAGSTADVDCTAGAVAGSQCVSGSVPSF